MGVFVRIMEGLASEAAVPKTVMIDATYLKAHRTATSLRSKKGGLMTVIPPESEGLHKQNFLGKMHEEILNEDKQIH